MFQFLGMVIGWVLLSIAMVGLGIILVTLSFILVRLVRGLPWKVWRY